MDKLNTYNGQQVSTTHKDDIGVSKKEPDIHSPHREDKTRTSITQKTMVCSVNIAAIPSLCVFCVIVLAQRSNWIATWQ